MARRFLVSLAILFFAANSARGQNPICFAGFANISPGAPANEPLILGTYKNLFEKMGGQSISLEGVAKLAQSEDPFTIPDQPGLDLGGLQKKLREFKEMLESTGWNTPEIRAVVRNDLATLAANGRVQAEKVEAVVRATAAEEKVTWPFEGTPVYSPQGDKILLTYSTPMFQNPRSSLSAIYDVATKTLNKGTTSVGSFLEGSFSNDGKWLVFGDVGNVLQVVPLDAHGKPRFNQAKQIGTKQTGGESEWKIQALTPGLSADRFYGHPDGGEGNMRPFLFNVVSGERHLVKIDAHLRGGRKAGPNSSRISINAWGRIPGSENLYFLVHEGSGVRRHVVSVDDAGNVTPIEKKLFWSFTDPALGESQVQRLQFGADGKTVVGWSGGMLSYVPPGAAVPKALDVKLDVQNESIAVVLTHPKKNEVIALIENSATMPNKAYRLEVFDLDTHVRRGSIPVEYLTEAPQLAFSPDGNSLLMTSKLKSTALSYEGRLVSPP